MTVHLMHSAAIACLLLLHACQSSRGQDHAGPPRSTHRSQHLSFDWKVGGPILLPVSIDGEIADFLFDTGASHHLLSHDYEARLGGPMYTRRAETASSPITVKVVEPPEMLVGGLKLTHDRPVGIVDLTAVSQVLGRSIPGIIGASFLSERVMVLDSDRRQVRFFDNDVQVMELRGDVIPVDADAAGEPYLPDVLVGDSRLSFLLDTGMGGSSVSLAKSDFQRLCDEGWIGSIRTSHSTTASGHAAGRSGILKSIQVGPFLHHSVTVAESNSNKLGLRYLSRFLATLHMASGRLYLEKGQAYSSPDDIDASGLTLLWIEEQVVVKWVGEYGPAEAAGILEGDVLVQLNGEPVTGDTLLDVRQALSGPAGTEMELVLSREEVHQRRRFQLRSYEDWGGQVPDSDAEVKRGKKASRAGGH